LSEEITVLEKKIKELDEQIVKKIPEYRKEEALKIVKANGLSMDTLAGQTMFDCCSKIYWIQAEIWVRFETERNQMKEVTKQLEELKKLRDQDTKK
jgi:hypothetical protein